MMFYAITKASVISMSNLGCSRRVLARRTLPRGMKPTRQLKGPYPLGDSLPHRLYLLLCCYETGMYML